MIFILFLWYADIISLACPFYTLLAIGHYRSDIVSNCMASPDSFPDPGDSGGWNTRSDQSLVPFARACPA